MITVTRKDLAASVIAMIWVLTGCDASNPQAAGGTETSARVEPSFHNSAPGTETFGRIQFALRGDPIVPPRDYAKGLEIPKADQYSILESGTIYDIVFAGLDRSEMKFEIRGYAIGDLERPETSQIFSFPLGQKTLELRNLVVDVEAAEAGSLTYKVQLNTNR